MASLEFLSQSAGFAKTNPRGIMVGVVPPDGDQRGIGSFRIEQVLLPVPLDFGLLGIEQVLLPIPPPISIWQEIMYQKAVLHLLRRGQPV